MFCDSQGTDFIPDLQVCIFNVAVHWICFAGSDTSGCAGLFVAVLWSLRRRPT